MTRDWKAVAQAALAGAETDSLSFPEAVAMLSEAGFDGYAVDFRRGMFAYYRNDGEALELASGRQSVAARFDTEALKAAIREAQTLAPGYTYKGFCAKAARAGCAGYLVSFGGRRALYHGRTGETHTEFFPGAPP